MPTDKQRVSIVADDELLSRMAEYQRNRGLTSMSKTACELIMKGLLAQDESLHNGQVYNGEEIQLLRAFKCADENDRAIILETVYRALAKSRKRQQSYTVSDEDYVQSMTIEEIELLISSYRQADKGARHKAMDALLVTDDNITEDDIRSAIQSSLRSSQGNQQTG